MAASNSETSSSGPSSGASGGKSSAQYRQKALQEIRNSLLPFMNNERPSSARSTLSEPTSPGHRKPSLNDASSLTYSVYSRDSTPSGSCAGSVRSDSPGVLGNGHANGHHPVSRHPHHYAERCLPEPPTRLLASSNGHHQPHHPFHHPGPAYDHNSLNNHHPHYKNHVQLGRQHSANGAFVNGGVPGHHLNGHGHHHMYNGHISSGASDRSSLSEAPPPLPPPRQPHGGMQPGGPLPCSSPPSINSSSNISSNSSNSSEYSSVPPSTLQSLQSLQLQKMLFASSVSGCSSQASSMSAASSSVSSAVSSVISSKHSTCGSSSTAALHASQQLRPSGLSGNAHIQAWGARQAKSQSPVIMQSVKSTHVQKPVLQTAIAPVAPVVVPTGMSSRISGSTTNLAHASAAKSDQVLDSSGSGLSSSLSNHHSSSNHLQQPQPSALSSSLSSVCSSVTSGGLANDGGALSSLGPSSKQGSSTTISEGSPPPYPVKAGPPGYAANRRTAIVNGNAIPPPPSYDSAVQDQAKASAGPSANPAPKRTLTSTTSIKSVSSTYSDNNSPPPPPPPPYTATLATVTQDKPVSYTPRPAAPPPGSDPPPPPSYASSVEALKLAKRGTGTCTKSTTGLGGSQMPARPPPPLPPNSDLVNTVESICASQVTGPSGGNNGPSLPPKPSISSCALSVQSSSCFTQSDTVSISESDCSSVTSTSNMSLSSNLTSLCSAPLSTTTASSAPRRPAPPPPAPSPAPATPSSSSGASATDTSTAEGAVAITKTVAHHSPMPQRKQLSKEKEQERRESKVRYYSPAAYKFFMEQHIENVTKCREQREQRRQKLEAEMEKNEMTEEAQNTMRKMLYQKESNYNRLRRAKMDKAMFVKLIRIGEGAFGEVALVQKVDSNVLYAMKTLRKKEVLKKNQVAHVKAERDILAEADNEWVVKLYFSFQDTEHLFFVMEYIPGGDLMSLLIKMEIFDENLARFYIAELTLAVESVHRMGFIHRDIKPDNILIDSDGHIKLTDFGLCTGFRWTHNSKYYQRTGDGHSRQDSLDLLNEEENGNQCAHLESIGVHNVNNHGGRNLGGLLGKGFPSTISKPLERRRRRCQHQRCQAHSLVGTPNYIAPEVLMRTGYAQTCDWWSVGVILYEMIVGSPPFYAQSPEETQNKVINWKTTLHIPKENGLGNHLSHEVRDLIKHLLCDTETRLGKMGNADEIKSHSFFRDIDFDPVSGIRKQVAPLIPKIHGPTDTSNFDVFDSNGSVDGNANGLDCRPNNKFDYVNGDRFEPNGKHPDHAFFSEFTFRRFFDDGGTAYPMRVGMGNGEHHNGQAIMPPTTENGPGGSPVYV